MTSPLKTTILQLLLVITASCCSIVVCGATEDMSLFTETETRYMNKFTSFGCSSIQWIDKNEDAKNIKIKADSVSPIIPAERNNGGMINDLDSFTTNRLSVLPPSVIDEALPTLIIENECASVKTSTDECLFDYAATPAPFTWALSDDLWRGGPDAFVNYKKKDMTVVYVPRADSTNDAKELTDIKDQSKPNLATLKVRGNGTRRSPKKQFDFDLKKPFEFIAGGGEHKRWVLSAYTTVQVPKSDSSYVDNKILFDSYTKIGELQKQYSDTWPEEGSVEDYTTRAFAPRSKMINLIFQGRYAGIFYIMDKVEVGPNRVYLPPEPEEEEESSNNNNRNTTMSNTSTPPPRMVDYVPMPSGTYLLARDVPLLYKRGIDNGEDLMIKNNYWSYGPKAGAYAWSIKGDNKSFALYKKDNDIKLLKGFLLQLDVWLREPIRNNHILSQVIDMPSMARYMLAAEIAREQDEFIASMFFKVVNGKLYHASPWDYAGTSFGSGLGAQESSPYVDPKTNSCGMYYSKSYEGWHVNQLFFGDFWRMTSYPDTSLQSSFRKNCSDYPLEANSKWFFQQLFRIPDLQTEFWKLFDIVVEHGLVDDEPSSGDLFQLDLVADKTFNPIKETAFADRKMWYGAMQLLSTDVGTEESSKRMAESGFCSKLEGALLASGAPNKTYVSPYSIPSIDWTFKNAARSGNFMDIFVDVQYSPWYTDNDFALEEKKIWIKQRLEWIASQHPSTHADNTSSHVPSENGAGASWLHSFDSLHIVFVIALAAILVFICNKFRKSKQIGYEKIPEDYMKRADTPDTIDSTAHASISSSIGSNEGVYSQHGVEVA